VGDFMFTTTPEKITPEILEFCNRISEGTSIYLEVQSLPTSEAKECIRNVKNYISHNGGSIQYGYRIWTWGQIMVEAELHAVWVSPDGDFVDITPADEKTVLFLPDNSITYEGVRIDNIRSALINEPIVHDLIKVLNQIYEIRLKASESKNSNNHAFALYLIAPLAHQQEVLMKKIADKYLNPSLPCFCGSGKEYQKCHKG
jgi:hypothetical protein